MVNVAHVLFVIGNDYFKKGLNFELYAMGRMKYLRSRNFKKEDCNFIFCHGPKGKIYQFQLRKGILNGPEDFKFKAKDASLRKLVDTDYNHGILKDDRFGLLNMKQIYDLVIELGTGDTARSIKEFNVFSHGVDDGPALFNSFANYVYDTDGRVRDFAFVTSGKIVSSKRISDRDRFRNAFQSGATAHIWGCSQTQIVCDLFDFIFHDTKRDYRDRGLSPDAILFFSPSNVNFSRLAEAAKNLIGADVKNLLMTTSGIEFGNILKIGKGLLQVHYSYVFCNAANITTYGPLPGTGADNDDAPPFPHMFLSKKSNLSKKIFNFYTHYLGIKQDPDGYGYAEFSPEPVK